MGIDKKSSLKKKFGPENGQVHEDIYGAKKLGIDDGGHIPADATTSGTMMMRAAGSDYVDDHIGRFADTGNIASI